MGKAWLMFLGVLAVLIGVSAPTGAQVSDEALEREQQARYYINYAGYLIDVGKYLEALENYEAAEEVSAIPKTKIDALLGKASLLSSFLDAPEDALKIYRDVRRHFSQGAEIANYREGLLLFDMQDYREAGSTLKEYLKTYPEGKFRYQTEALLSEIAKVPATAAVPEIVSAIPSAVVPRSHQTVATPPSVIVPETTVASETVAAVAPAAVTPEATAVPQPRETPPLLSKATTPQTSAPQPATTEPAPGVPPIAARAPEQKADASPSAIVPEVTAVRETPAPAAPIEVTPQATTVSQLPETPPPLSKSTTPQVLATQPATTKPAAPPISLPRPEQKATNPLSASLPTVPDAAALSTRKTTPTVTERKSPDVRVRMCKTTGETRLEGTRICVAGLECRDRFTLGIKNGKILVNDSQVSATLLRFESENPITIVCETKRKRVRGKISVGIREGLLLVVNIVDIEDYLLSVVPSENPASWPVESLKAQAVAARTYAYYQLLHRKDWAYDLVDYAGDQAYGGMEKEHPRSTEAVKATAGEILVYENKPILAMFSANSGGYTADSASVFSLYKPYLLAKKDPASLKGSMADWTKKYTVSEVVSALRKINIDAGGLKEIEAAEQGPSGRIIKVRLVQSNGKTQVLRNRTTLRRALDLPEILHGIRREGNTFIFEGHGWGHGVGYSQWGSAYLGKNKTYTEILSFYYGDAKIEKMW